MYLGYEYQIWQIEHANVDPDIAASARQVFHGHLDQITINGGEAVGRWLSRLGIENERAKE